MKIQKNKRPQKTKAQSKKLQTRVIKELVTHFEADLNKSLPITIQPNGSIVYKSYYIKQLDNSNWGLYNLKSKDLVEQFYLKTSAIMAAKAYDRTQIETFYKIKQLDSDYWANHSDFLVYSHNIKLAKEFDRFIVLLNKLEYTEQLAEQYKAKISSMFRGTFV
jgi:hypothetical protein